ncbi:5' nucleotidase, NT5C type [Eudoraea adriatica]|uniref:5' nucleotidase, NT5C type n=1 Tax=Eudoraea adriatica TaxID=446681 RepID=UPI000364654E|nr:hypothetical protein [Eudoraea adriatica]
MSKKILYVDMDNVLVNLPAGMSKVDPEILKAYGDDPDEIPGIFGLMPPLEQAIESYAQLSEWFNTYILSTAPWKNHSAWSDKVKWVQKYLGKPAYKRLILSHNKHLNLGDYLIDDRDANGAKDFQGEWIHFKSELFPDWPAVMDYMRQRR